jgi:histidine triad (HIT) family protein
MASIFTKLISGELPCYKVGETDTCFAFLDISPLHIGHTLIVPKQEFNYLFDLPNELYADLMLFSKKVAHALGKAVPCERIGLAVIGLEVPHAHIHLVPINTVGDIDFSRPKLQFTPQEMEEVLGKIRKNLD